jgi:hypothetical protein
MPVTLCCCMLYAATTASHTVRISSSQRISTVYTSTSHSIVAQCCSSVASHELSVYTSWSVRTTIRFASVRQQHCIVTSSLFAPLIRRLHCSATGSGLCLCYAAGTQCRGLTCLHKLLFLQPLRQSERPLRWNILVQSDNAVTSSLRGTAMRTESSRKMIQSHMKQKLETQCLPRGEAFWPYHSSLEKQIQALKSWPSYCQALAHKPKTQRRVTFP